MAAVLELGDAVAITESLARSDSMARRALTRNTSELNDSKTLNVQTSVTNSEERAAPNEKGQVADQTRTPAMRRKEKWQLFSLCFTLFLAGWDGGTTGPLIPRMQLFYNVR